MIQLNQRTPIYREPGSVGHTIVTILPRGAMVDPIAVFGDFVKVRWQESRTEQEGFLRQATLARVPSDLPTLADWQLPSIERTIVPSDCALVFDLPSDCYHRYPIFGSATRVSSTLMLSVALDVSVTPDADRDASNGIFFGNERSGFAFVYQNQGWNFFRYVGNNIVFGKQTWKTSTRRCEFSIRLFDGGRSVSVCLPTARTVRYDLGNAIFANSDTAYLSVQLAPGSMVELLAASIQAIPDGRFEEALDWTAPRLRQLANCRGITFGTLPDGGWYGSELDHQLLTAHANLLVWHLDWNDHANLVTSTRLAFAKANDMRVRAHPLIWHKQLPSWLEYGDHTDAELSHLMDKRITSLMSKHAADEWVVVNEALAVNRVDCDFIDNVFYRSFGGEYVDMAFHLARAADSKSVLLYNEDYIETPGPKADRCYRLLRGMLQRGVPVDGLGMQFHLLTWTAEIPTKEEMVANLARFADLGLDLYVTELDVNLVHLNASPQHKLTIQAKIYRDVVETCLATGICKSVTTWGFNDRASWLFDEPCGGEAPLLFDRHNRVKPAFTAIQEALFQPFRVGA